MRDDELRLGDGVVVIGLEQQRPRGRRGIDQIQAALRRDHTHGGWAVGVTDNQGHYAKLSRETMDEAMADAGAAKWDEVNGHAVPAADETPAEISAAVVEAFPELQDWHVQPGGDTYSWSTTDPNDEQGVISEWALQQATQGPTVRGWKITMNDGDFDYEHFAVTVDEVLAEAKAGEWETTTETD